MSSVRRVIRKLRGLVPVESRLQALEADRAQLAAQVASIDRTLSSIADLVGQQDQSVPSAERDLATALRDRFDHGLLHADAVAAETRRSNDRALADVRSAVRLAQATAEQAAALLVAGDGPAPGAGPSPEPATSWKNPTPTFDGLYRAFEDSHRGSAEEIRERQATDYADLFDGFAAASLPVADLGCGRGELVSLIAERGVKVIGVDTNQGQLVEAGDVLFERADMFEWLDRQPDSSLAAVFSLHVIEHLPIDLQVRLVFEARRVLAPGGVLVLETPNALSVTTAATNFWVDPTHNRPVHPLLLEFLAREAGFAEIDLRPLHPLSVSFRGDAEAPELVSDLNSLLLGCGDVALVAYR